ncbi:MAG: trigger factor, partial [Nitrospinaceae bacterium]
EDSGFDPERAKKEWREKAEFNAKGYMLLEAIAGKEGLHVTQEDLESEYEKLAQQTGKKIEAVKASLVHNPESMAQTTSKLLGQKAMNFLYAHAEFNYVKELPKAEENVA